MLTVFVALAAAAVTPACTNPRSQAEMNRCAGTDFSRADAAMAQQWRATNAFMKSLDSADRSKGGGFGFGAALLESQRAWLKYRDAQCVIEAGRYAGGSVSTMERLLCATRVTNAREAELRAMAWRR